MLVIHESIGNVTTAWIKIKKTYMSHLQVYMSEVTQPAPKEKARSMSIRWGEICNISHI